MTVIAAITDGKRVTMGADSCSTSQSGETTRLDEAKIIVKGDMLIGVTGCLRGLQILKYQWDLPERPDGISDQEYICVDVVNSIKDVFMVHSYCIMDQEQAFQEDNYLIGYKGCIYHIESNYQVVTSRSCLYAIGSGAAYTLGSLKTQDDLFILTKDTERGMILAIEAACEYCNTVCRPINIYSI